MIEINFNPTRKDLRVFAILEVIFFGVVAGIVYRKTGSATVPAMIVGAALLVGVVGWFVPAFMRWVYVGWMLAVFPIVAAVLALVFLRTAPKVTGYAHLE